MRVRQPGVWEPHSSVLTRAAAITTEGKLNIVDIAAREPGKKYAKWNGKAIEVG
jgi:hypothetical protein